MSETELRELDARVHREVMGRECDYVLGCVGYGMYAEIEQYEDGHRFGSKLVPPYSATIAAAWLVVEKMQSADIYFDLEYTNEPVPWFCSFRNGTGEFGQTAPEAIARAAIAALTGAAT